MCHVSRHSQCQIPLKSPNIHCKSCLTYDWETIEVILCLCHIHFRDSSIALYFERVSLFFYSCPNYNLYLNAILKKSFERGKKKKRSESN